MIQNVKTHYKLGGIIMGIIEKMRLDGKILIVQKKSI